MVPNVKPNINYIMRKSSIFVAKRSFATDPHFLFLHDGYALGKSSIISIERTIYDKNLKISDNNLIEGDKIVIIRRMENNQVWINWYSERLYPKQ